MTNMTFLYFFINLAPPSLWLVASMFRVMTFRNYDPPHTRWTVHV